MMNFDDDTSQEKEQCINCKTIGMIRYADRNECEAIPETKFYYLDESFGIINSDYEAKRYKDLTLQQLEIIPARPGLFNDWLKSKGKLGGQHKVPRLANNRDIIEEVLAGN